MDVEFGLEVVDLLSRMSGLELGFVKRIAGATAIALIKSDMVYTMYDDARFSLVERYLGRELSDVERYAVAHIARTNAAFRVAAGVNEVAMGLTPAQKRVVLQVAKLIKDSAL